MSDTRTYLKSIGIGVIAGMRSMAALALVSNHLSSTGTTRLYGTRLAPLVQSRTARLLNVAAIGEMLSDKMPFLPNRTSAIPLMGRIASGAIAGGAVAAAGKQKLLVGAVLGGLAAAAGSYAFYYLRKSAGAKSHIPDALLGIAEDAIATAGGVLIAERDGVRRKKSRKKAASVLQAVVGAA